MLLSNQLPIGKKILFHECRCSQLNQNYIFPYENDQVLVRCFVLFFQIGEKSHKGGNTIISKKGTTIMIENLMSNYFYNH